MFEVLFNLIIKPLVICYELIFGLTDKILRAKGIGNYFIDIMIVSIIVNILTFPLYKRADHIQEQIKQKKESMKSAIEHIKKCFSGDEQYFMLSTYYKEQNYKPIYTLQESISLLLQIPFFTAAYMFFSNLGYVSGESIVFGIKNISLILTNDLSKPDNLLTIGNAYINVWPIIMTIINFISSCIYTKGSSFKDRIQPFILAIIFLIILYNSPSILVIYWTLNNIFSLIKIIYLKSRKTERENNKEIKNNNVFFILKNKIKNFFNDENIILDKKFCKILFIITAINFVLFLGILIPTNVIKSSPQEFEIFTYSYKNILFNTLITYIGIALWIGVFYSFSKNKKIFSLCFFAIVIYMMFNYFVYDNNNGFISTALVYDRGITKYRFIIKAINIIIALLIVSVVIKMKKHKKAYLAFSSVVMLSLMSIFILSDNEIKKTINEYYDNIDGLDDLGDRGIEKKLARQNDFIDEKEVDKFINISTKGKNVFYIFADRYIGRYFPYVLEMKPELKEKLNGFTYYPNTISFGPQTIVGAPGLYGGYEYIPYEANKRDGLIVDKHNEALKVMPTIFSNNGYNVLITDVPYENYGDVSKESIFKGLSNVNSMYIKGRVDSEVLRENIGDSFSKISRNFIYYSVFKTMPLFLRNSIYDYGNYLYKKGNNELIYDNNFLEAFTLLKNFPNWSNIKEDDSNNANIIYTDIAHCHNLLPYPDFYPDNTNVNEIANENIKLQVNGQEFGQGYQHLDSEVAGLNEILKFFDFLKENDVYDNSKIIIISDHGWTETDFDKQACSQIQNPNNYEVNQFKTKWDIRVDDSDKMVLNTQSFHPLLLVKDFNETHELLTSDEFMTNADGPYLALKDVDEKIVNPYTGNEINMNYKKDNEKIFLSLSITKTSPRELIGENKYRNVYDDIYYLSFDKSDIYNTTYTIIKYEDTMEE